MSEDRIADCWLLLLVGSFIRGIRVQSWRDFDQLRSNDLGAFSGGQNIITFKFSPTLWPSKLHDEFSERLDVSGD
jgi:hypothetical protein